MSDMSKIKRWKVSLPSPDGYDIQPFDTTFHTPQEIVLAADYDAEIERLRDQVTRLSTLVDTERSLHDAEIERLREKEATAEIIFETNKKQREEIERLKMELTKVGNGSYNPSIVLAERDAEIERLRGLLLKGCDAQHIEF